MVRKLSNYRRFLVHHMNPTRNIHTPPRYEYSEKPRAKTRRRHRRSAVRKVFDGNSREFSLNSIGYIILFFHVIFLSDRFLSGIRRTVNVTVYSIKIWSDMPLCRTRWFIDYNKKLSKNNDNNDRVGWKMRWIKSVARDRIVVATVVQNNNQYPSALKQFTAVIFFIRNNN